MKTRRGLALGPLLLLAVLALLSRAVRPPAAAADDGMAAATAVPTAPVVVASAYAAAFEAGDAARIAATLSDDVVFGDHFCCPGHPTKAQFVDTIPHYAGWGFRTRFVLGTATGDTVTLRVLNNYETDWRAGIAPIEIVYTLVVKDGLIVQADGTVDAAALQRRAASVARATAQADPARPGVPVPPDTQGRGTPSMGPWIAAAVLAVVGTAVIASLQRRPTGG